MSGTYTESTPSAASNRSATWQGTSQDTTSIISSKSKRFGKDITRTESPHSSCMAMLRWSPFRVFEYVSDLRVPEWRILAVHHAWRRRDPLSKPIGVPRNRAELADPDSAHQHTAV